MNLMKINNINAVIQYDPEIEMFRGEFVELNGGADFYAKDIESLKKEGAISLKVFLDACKKRNIEPKKKFQVNLMCVYLPIFMQILPVLLWLKEKA